MTDDIERKIESVRIGIGQKIQIPEEIGDCRKCIHYSYDRDIEVEFFLCKRGYFNHVDYAGTCEDVGKMNWYGCKGNEFVPK